MAFEDVDATELYPCVMFYSSNPGEKVRQREAQLHLHPNNNKINKIWSSGLLLV